MKFSLPTFCNHFENLIVEEFSFLPHPAILHYGKCSVIGRIRFDYDTNGYFLDSFRIYSLKGSGSLQDGFSSVQLFWVLSGISLPNNTNVEVLGQAILLDKSIRYRSFGAMPITSWDLVARLSDLQRQLEGAEGLKARCPTGLDDESLIPSVRDGLQKEYDEMKSRYIPSIQVFSIHRISEPHDLIQSNLELRQLRQRKNKS